ncbi:MAG: iron-containing alcohol dehydrogenase [Verrucomicrobiales bacterium]|nr:iron-containing alcohol dehydrogenase [Verrucomicrobiales bacterium]
MALTLESVCSGLGASAEVVNFAHSAGTSVVFGEGVIAQIGALCAGISERGKVLVVTDGGIARAGHVDRVRPHLEAAGFEVEVFDQVHEDPTTEDVDACVESAARAGVKVIIGLGGGSSMDTAKGCNFILTNGGEMKDYWGVGKATKKMLPFIAVPTTAGTGSECQSFALIADAKTHQKMACGDKKSAAAVAILDPELTLTQPSAVTAHTGIDAIAHAVETAVTAKRSEVSQAYSKLGFLLLERSFETVLADADNLRARAEMQLGAAYAGTAIENSMLGAAHSAANPLSAHYGIIHGEAVGMMLPHVVRLNATNEACEQIYRELYPRGLVERLEQLLEVAGMAKPLSAYGVDPAQIPTLASEAASQWTAQFNPVGADKGVFEALYRAAL